MEKKQHSIKKTLETSERSGGDDSGAGEGVVCGSPPPAVIRLMCVCVGKEGKRGEERKRRRKRKRSRRGYAPHGGVRGREEEQWLQRSKSRGDNSVLWSRGGVTEERWVQQRGIEPTPR